MVRAALSRADNLVSSLVVYAEIVSRAGLRENIVVEILQSIGLQDRKVEVHLTLQGAAKVAT